LWLRLLYKSGMTELLRQCRARVRMFAPTPVRSLNCRTRTTKTQNHAQQRQTTQARYKHAAPNAQEEANANKTANGPSWATYRYGLGAPAEAALPRDKCDPSKVHGKGRELQLGERSHIGALHEVFKLLDLLLDVIDGHLRVLNVAGDGKLLDAVADRNQLGGLPLETVHGDRAD